MKVLNFGIPDIFYHFYDSFLIQKHDILLMYVNNYISLKNYSFPYCRLCIFLLKIFPNILCFLVLSGEKFFKELAHLIHFLLVQRDHMDILHINQVSGQYHQFLKS